MTRFSLARRGFVVGAAVFASIPQTGLSQEGRWQVLDSSHPLWADGLEGVALQLPDDSFAMLLLRPDGQSALASVAFPGTPGQVELTSTLEMANGGTPRLIIDGDNLLNLPAPKEGFAAYGFVIDVEDFALLQAGLNWRLATATEEQVFPLTGSRVAIAEALALRSAAQEVQASTAAD